MFIIIGLLLALVAAGGVYLVGTTFGAGGIVGGSSTTVVIAKQAIPVRHQITAADLDTEKVTATLTGTYTKASDIVSQGYIAEIQISKGSIITGDMLAKDINLIPAGAAPAYLPLAPGWVAMTIPTGEQQGVAGHITVGDYITVIASGQLLLFGGDPKKVVSKTVFTDVRIIGLGPSAPNVQPASGGTTVGTTTAQNGGITSSLTIEITQCDAEYLTWFLNNMQEKYTLKSFKDYGTAPLIADPSCPTVLKAGGVTNSQVETRYKFAELGA